MTRADQRPSALRKWARAVAFAVVLILLAGTGWGIARAIDPDVTAEEARAEAARTAGGIFLDNYVESDGRVVRRDEGGDVVSEGQAYAMLVAVAIDDEDRFRSVWSWTKTHLMRPDGVLSWRWDRGAVTDPNSAADADLDAARALLVAGERFDAAELTTDGEALGSAVLATETVTVGTTTAPLGSGPPQPGSGVAGTGRMLTAGTWTTAAPYTINPSYFSPRAEQDLRMASSDGRWSALTRTHRIIGSQLMGAGRLPPDWAVVDALGGATASRPPSGAAIQFGLDAARFPIRMAESCNADDRALAAAMRPALTTVDNPPAVRNLDGTTAQDFQHPIAQIAAAATHHAADDEEGTARFLDAATAVQQQYPTYYGAAWLALGHIMLGTSLLGDCGGSLT